MNKTEVVHKHSRLAEVSVRLTLLSKVVVVVHYPLPKLFSIDIFGYYFTNAYLIINFSLTEL